MHSPKDNQRAMNAEEMQSSCAECEATVSAKLRSTQCGAQLAGMLYFVSFSMGEHINLCNQPLCCLNLIAVQAGTHTTLTWLVKTQNVLSGRCV